MADATAERRVRPMDHLQLWLYLAVESLLRLLPLPLCHAVGTLCGTVFWAVSRQYRRLVTRNLRIAGNIDGSDPELPRLVRRTMQTACANLICSSRTALMPLDKLRDHVEAEGSEILAQTLTEGRGLIQVLSHMGNWEILAQASWLFAPPGAKLGAIYRPIPNPLIDDLIHRRRESQGTHLFSRQDGFHQVTGFLREGAMIGVLSDQRAGHKGIITPFFGRLSSCSGLPELLARRTGAELVTCTITTTRPGHWKLHYRKIDSTTTDDIMKALGTAMADSLPDVFWLHDRWRVDRGRPLTFFTKRPKIQGLEHLERPFRLLLSCRGLEHEARSAAIDQILSARPDVNIELLDDGSTTGLTDSDRIRHLHYDPTCPPEHLTGILEKLDAEGADPFDAAILLDGDTDLARACRRIGIRSVVGATTAAAKHPWTRTLPPADDADGWRTIARKFGAVPLDPSGR